MSGKGESIIGKINHIKDIKEWGKIIADRLLNRPLGMFFAHITVNIHRCLNIDIFEILMS